MTTAPHRAADPVYRTVLVPLDGSHFAAGALPTAHALAARFGSTVHTFTVGDSDHELQRIRGEAAQALGTEPDDPRIHLEISADANTDVAGAVLRCASQLDSCLICMSTHGRGRLADVLVGSTARDILGRSGEPVVLAGPSVVDSESEKRVSPPLGVDHLVACVDGTPVSEQGLQVATAWAHALGMKLTIVTVAEPSPPPVRIGAPWRRHHGPDEDADEYLRRLGEQWAPEAPGLDTFVVYDPVSPASGMRDYLASHPTGLIAVTSHVPNKLAHAIFGSGAADIVRSSTAPALVVPARSVEA